MRYTLPFMSNSVYKIVIRAGIAFLWLSLAGGPLPLRAAAQQSKEAVSWLYKAVDAYDHEDYGGSKTSLAMALQMEPNFAEAYLLKGLLEYRDGLVDKANASWQRALQLNPRLPSDMRQQLEKKAHAIESNLTFEDFSHFHLQFNGAEQRDQAWQAVKFLDEAYNDLGSRFGVFPAERTPVIIFTTEEFWEAWSAPYWLGGFFDNRDGRVRVRMDPPPGGDEEFRRRLRHEFTHAFIHQLYPNELPVWFQEGIAQFYAYENPTNSFWKDSRLDELQKSMKHAPWMDMAQIERVLRKKDVHPGMIYLGYLESEALILSIAKDRGDSWIPSVVERLRKGDSFESAFQAVVGVTPVDALDHLHHSLS